MLRFFETRGVLRRSLSVLASRCAPHEKTIREMYLTSNGVQIGRVLRDLSGTLSGFPGSEERTDMLIESGAKEIGND